MYSIADSGWIVADGGGFGGGQHEGSPALIRSGVADRADDALPLTLAEHRDPEEVHGIIDRCFELGDPGERECLQSSVADLCNEF